VRGAGWVLPEVRRAAAVHGSKDKQPERDTTAATSGSCGRLDDFRQQRGQNMNKHFIIL
jgi:hypothetical protein